MRVLPGDAIALGHGTRHLVLAAVGTVVRLATFYSDGDQLTLHSFGAAYVERSLRDEPGAAHVSPESDR